MVIGYFVERGKIMTKKVMKKDISNINNINDNRTWVYPNIPSGVTVVRKEKVTEDEIYSIYKDCIDIQRNAYIRLITTDKIGEIDKIYKKTEE